MGKCTRCGKLEHLRRRRLCNACYRYVNREGIRNDFPRINYTHEQLIAAYDKLQADTRRRTGKTLPYVVAAQLLGRSITTLKYHLQKRARSNGTVRPTQD